MRESAVSNDKYYYDGDQEIAEYSGSSLTRRYIRLPGSVDEVLLMVDYTLDAGCTLTSYAACQVWVHADRLGSTVMTSNSTGAKIDTYTYSPYGESGDEGDSGFLFRYTGQKLDAATGLYHYKVRWYDPETGRFLQTDPIGYRDGMNMYNYVGGDPVSLVDPSGMRGQRRCDPDKNYSDDCDRDAPEEDPFPWITDEIVTIATRLKQSKLSSVSLRFGVFSALQQGMAEAASQAEKAYCDIVSNEYVQAGLSGAVGGAVTGGLLGNVAGAAIGGAVGGLGGAASQFAANEFGNSSFVGGAVGAATELMTGGKAPGFGGGAAGGIVGGPVGGFIAGGIAVGGNNVFDYSRTSTGARIHPKGSAISNLGPEFSRGLLKGGVAGIAGAGASAGVASIMDDMSNRCLQ